MDSAKVRCGKLAFCVIPAAPPEDPPQDLCLSNGFFGIVFVFVEKEPKPNSSWVVFPIIIAPSFIIFSMTVALKGGL